MKSLLLASLLILSTSAMAVTDNPDGGVTLTKEEAKNVVMNILEMETQIKFYEEAMEEANKVLQYLTETKSKCI